MASSYAYNAFISYSHDRDAGLARALQTGLERFAKPWYRVRAARVFRDTANLSANPDLWKSIEDALDGAEWLIVLVSADSAASAWVNREVEWWLARKSPERLLVVAAGPGLAWDDAANDWAPSATVPPALRHAFAREPLWVDFSDLRPDGRRPQIEPERLATVAAAIHGVPKDTIIGDHLRERRRTVRVAGSAAAGLAVLTVFSVVASVVAVGQRDTAQAQARLATSGELAALAVSDLGTNLDTADLLAVAAYRTQATPQTEGALLQADAASPHLVRFLPVGYTVTALAAAADGATAVAGTADGQLISVNLVTGRRVSVATGLRGISEVGVSADGHAVVATDDTSAVFWTPGKPALKLGSMRSAEGVAVSPGGGETAVIYGAGTGSASEHVLLRDNPSGAEHTITVPGLNSGVAFPSDSRLQVTTDGGTEEWSVPAPRLLSRFTYTPEFPYDSFTPGASANGDYAGFTKNGYVRLWSTTHATNGAYIPAVTSGGGESGLAISPDGSAVAVAAGGVIGVAQGTSYQSIEASHDITQLTGGGDVTAVAFAGGDDTVVSAAGTTLELWNLRQSSRLGRDTGVSIPDASTVGPPPTLAFSPDGRDLAIVDGFQDSVSVYRADVGFRAMSGGTGGEGAGLPLWRGNQLLLLTQDQGGDLVFTNRDGRPVEFVGRVPDRGEVLAATLLPGQDRLVTVDNLGGAESYDLGTGQGQQAAPPQADVKDNRRAFVQAAISPDGTGAVVTESPADSFSSDALYIDLGSGRAHAIGSGSADAAVFSGGDLLVQRETGNLEIWNETATRPLRTLTGSGTYTPALAISPSGALLARVRDDGKASVTDLATGEVLATFPLPVPADSLADDPWSVTTLAFTPDGKDLLAATNGGVMTEWDLSPDSLIRSVCAVAGRSLTAAEWQEYVHTSPPSNLSCADGSGAG